jgi:hydrogenase maturation protease
VGQFRYSSHAFGVAEGIELARALGRLPCRLIVIGIEGIRFDHGESPSAEVAKAVERLAQHIAKEVDTLYKLSKESRRRGRLTATL